MISMEPTLVLIAHSGLIGMKKKKLLFFLLFLQFLWTEGRVLLPVSPNSPLLAASQTCGGWGAIALCVSGQTVLSCSCAV